ncbi:septum formation inhibitor Maf [Psychroserpens luteus]|uniref:Septum formation inhibitor Maf n=1 Tax=Psychroserpens luteus TaxID=1434066 RepID=A0ABW5ZP07_9FLAO|nr:septum formation inhibitor Maf [Psychroserpens luteus]
MKKLHIVMLIFFGIFASCKDNSTQKDQVLNNEPIPEASKTLPKSPAFEQSQEFKDYWYAGEAEITSYKLEQARYGEMRDGSAVLVFVTEDFLPKKQVKADQYDKTNTPVLKLNSTKKFNTGIYPYSIMQSTFYPVSNNQHALKVSCSVQEWCGHIYSQLNNRDLFEITSHSYFESDADQEFTLEKVVLENELWTQLRLDPKSLPVGDFEIIPSMEFIRLKHIEMKPYFAKAINKEGKYTIYYNEFDRKLTINYNPNFPYEITSWEETFKDGYGTNAKTLTTKATKLKTIKSAYWNKKTNADGILRETLQLKR